MPIDKAIVICLLTTLLAAPSAGAQDTTGALNQETVFVFLDCNARNCDYDHFRREITWVNWVRVQQDADVHLLITAEQTGGNGLRYQLDFLGRRYFAEDDRVFTYVSDRNDTDTEVRNELTRAIERGLYHYVEERPIVNQLEITHAQPRTGLQLLEQDDPWNLWVFRISVDGELEAEAGQDSYAIGGRASADRVTPDFKIGINFFGDYEHATYELGEDEGTYVDIGENYTFVGLAVWSLSDHWSAGVRAEADRSTFYNRDLAVSGGPAIEYNIYPYEESTRRQVTFRYVVEPASFDYTELTVEQKTSEVLARHSLILSAAVQQPWGEVFGSVQGIQYLHDLATHRINTFFNVEYRLFRGFSLDFRGGFARIKDQFYLAAEGNTIEEILLQRQQRETAWEYDLRFGITYQFGSSFANVVNPRMGGRRFF